MSNLLQTIADRQRRNRVRDLLFGALVVIVGSASLLALGQIM